jgi:FkbM family methyltransferase
MKLNFFVPSNILKSRFLVINFLLLFPSIYKKYQIGQFESLRRIFMPNYELEYKKLTQIIEFQSRKIERVLDIGANIGQSSYTFRKIFPNAEIHAFEPNPLIFEVLRKNLKKSKIQVYNFGLGQVNSTSKIYIPEYKNVLFTGLGSCSQKQAENYLKRNIINFNSSKFSIFIQEIMIKTGDSLNFIPDFIKIDVEGFEVGVLRGLMDTIKKHRPIVLVECSNSYYEVNKLFNICSYHNLEYSKAEKSWIPSTGKNLMQIFVSSN